MGFGLYLHIPYCLAKCRYCDFYSAGASRAVPDEYVNALIARMAAMCPGRPQTVYFGGGLFLSQLGLSWRRWVQGALFLAAGVAFLMVVRSANKEVEARPDAAPDVFLRISIAQLLPARKRRGGGRLRYSF